MTHRQKTAAASTVFLMYFLFAFGFNRVEVMFFFYIFNLTYTYDSYLPLHCVIASQKTCANLNERMGAT